MPSQLVYTSAPRGLVSGQSGFCVVARSADLREALSQRLERISSYHYLEVTTAHLSSTISGANLTICAYRVLDLRGTKYHVLTRIQPTGLDFTARTNHLAQHLAFLPEELPRLPAPAAILRHWDGWLGAWQGEPRILDSLAAEAFSRIPAPAWPAMSWKNLTGDGGRAASLLEPEFARGCYLSLPLGGEDQLLALFCEASQLSDADGKTPLRPWQYAFTNFLQAEDAVAEFQWRGCRPGTPAAEVAARRGVTLTEVTSIRVPNNPLAKLAREGPAPAETNLKGRVTLRRDDSPARPTQRPGWADFEPITESSSPRARRTGVYLTINTNVLRILAVALVLALLALGLLKHFGVVWFKPAAGPPSSPGDPIATKPTPVRQPAPSVSSPPRENIVAAPSPPAPGPTPEQALEALNRLPEIQTYVAVAPSFTSSPVLPLPSIGPLQQLLVRFNQINVKTNDLDLRFAHDLWELPSVMESMRVDSRPAERKLQAVTAGLISGFRAQVTFDYSGADTPGGMPVRASLVAPDTAKSLSLLFRPAPGTAVNFEPFRILFLNGSSPPRSLAFPKDQLNLQAQNLADVLAPALWKRLAWLQSIQWQLRPLADSPSGDCQDLYAGWLADEQPRPGEELALSAAAARLTARRENDVRQVTSLASNVAALKEAIQPKLDAKLQLGAWLKLDSDPKLRSFADFRNSQPPASGSVAGLLPEYLDQVRKKAEPQHPWVREWPILRGKTDNFQTIHDLCLKNLDPKPSALKSSSNYFLTLWRNLGLEDQENELERKQNALESEIVRLNQQIDRIPPTLGDVPCFSLCLPGYDNRPVEMIRFR